MAPQTPIPPSFQVERVSVASDGTEANAGSSSFSPSISADGRYVAYQSDASNLVPGDTNNANDVFVFDRETNTTEGVSVASNGTESGSTGPSLSADGRFVTYRSEASNLVPGDTNGVADIFVFDRQANTTERVSVASDGTEENSFSSDPSISADGHYVTYWSDASNLVPGDTNSNLDIFVFDRQANITERISVASDGTEGNNFSSGPSISADGRFVAYQSFASNLVPGDTNSANDIFVFDRQTDTTTRVSVASDGTEANGGSVGSSISADGRFVAYFSFASNLVPGDTNGVADVFVFDRQANTTERVSVASNGTEGNADSFETSISADGRFVIYTSAASNLVPGDTNAIQDIFVFDRQTDTTTRVSVASDGTEADGGSLGIGSGEPSISADGRTVAYFSFASNLVPGDTNDSYDVFAVQTDGALPVDGVIKDGDEGNNILKGTRRDDILRGHGGKDWLFGDKGDDSLDGGTGNDKIWSGKGDDTVLGGADHDRIWTGKGSDLVIFNEGDGHDRVFDFDQRRHENDRRYDRVQLDVSIGSNAIDDFEELEALIASGDIGVSTRKCSLTLTFDNRDALTLRGVRELSADDWLFM